MAEDDLGRGRGKSRPKGKAQSRAGGGEREQESQDEEGVSPVESAQGESSPDEGERQAGKAGNTRPEMTRPDTGPDGADETETRDETGTQTEVEREEFYEDFVLVTGVSSGIGYATVAELLEADYQVLGSVRTQADADRLVETFGDDFHPLIFDVTDVEAVRAAAEQTRSIVGDNGLYGLVNNAGVAVGGPLQHLPLEDFRRPFEVNVFGALNVTQAFLPLLGADHSSDLPAGRIVNISSISGHTVYPFVGPYAASKYAMEALSDGLRRELLIYGIKVILVVPGSVNTPIWKKSEARDFDRFADTDYGPALEEIRKNVDNAGRQGMPVERVSQTVRLALEAEQPKSRYILANSWWFGWFLPRWLPSEWMDRALARQLTMS